MALNGVHVTCTKVLTTNSASLRMPHPQDWSEDLTLPATTAHVTPAGQSLVKIIASVDVYYAVGTTPNATLASGDGQSAREYLPANTREEIWVQAGNKIAFVAA